MSGTTQNGPLIRRMAFVVVAFAVAAVILGAALLPVNAGGEKRGGPLSSAGLRVENLAIVKQDGTRETFTVEIAETPAQLQNGLMHREEMEKDAGMLFYFGGGEGEVSFWMKNTLIPLDMIFIRADGTIAHIHENAVPHSLQSVPSRYPVTAVLEINGGESAARGIRTGDRIEHPYFRSVRGVDAAQEEAVQKDAGQEDAAQEEAPPATGQPAPLSIGIEPPTVVDPMYERGLDADVQQR